MRWAIVALLAMAAACGGDEAADAPAAVDKTPPKDAITKVAETGPVKATVMVWPAKPSLGEPIYMRLEVEAPAGISLDVPFQEAGAGGLGRFTITASTDETERTPGGGQIRRQLYTLEAFSSGRHRVPPLRIELIDARGTPAAPPAGSAAPDPRGKAQELLTDEIALEIAPVKAESADAELAPPRGALDEQVGGTSPLAVLGGVSALLVLGSGGLLIWRALRVRRRVALQRSAYDDAVSALRALEERGAPDADTADAWFVELSAIVRRYLEQRYEIRAPELTTEEFLLVATARAELREDHRGLLTAFLERCDRVKFAGYRPDAAESLASLAAARGFVEDTRLRLAEAA